MRLENLKKDPDPGARTKMQVVIISGSCCIPGMKPFDEQARLVVERAVHETGSNVGLTVIPATTAMFGGVSKEIMAELVGMFNSGGKVGLPAVLIDGRVVSFGVPTMEVMKEVLNGSQITENNIGQQISKDNEGDNRC